MPITRVVATINMDSNLIEDAVQNVWHIGHSAALTSPARIAIRDAFRTFYAALNPFWSSEVNETELAHTLKFYDLVKGSPGAGDDSAGSPSANYGMTLTPSASTHAPSEVALCLSLKAPTGGVREELGATRPAARRRGRVFLGPFSQAQMSRRPEATIREAVLDAAVALNLAVSAYGEIGIYSRADAMLWGANECSVDDTWDTQRRRGVKRTLKDVRPLVGGGSF